jgi:hypothetical protein
MDVRKVNIEWEAYISFRLGGLGRVLERMGFMADEGTSQTNTTETIAGKVTPCAISLR